MPKREDERCLNLQEDARWCSRHQCWYQEGAGCPYCEGRDIFKNVIWPKGRDKDSSGGNV